MNERKEPWPIQNPPFWDKEDKDVDQTDDWWDSSLPIWYGDAPKNAIEYRILRAQKTPCEGSPGFIVQWVIYQTFDNQKDRDSMLKTLNNNHPKWRIRASEGNPYLERLGISKLPTEGINE